jgi:hypothetical protein
LSVYRCPQTCRFATGPPRGSIPQGDFLRDGTLEAARSVLESAKAR